MCSGQRNHNVNSLVLVWGRYSDYSGFGGPHSAASENHQAAATDPSAAEDRYRTAFHRAKNDVRSVWQFVDAVVAGTVGMAGSPQVGEGAVAEFDF
jgi:hypothetical protein